MEEIMTNEVMKIEGQGIDFAAPKMIETLKATVAQGLNDPEFAVFAEHCKATGLNPFKKEVWAIKAGGRLQIMTGINGYWQIANRHPQFDGAETGMITKAGEWVKSVPGNDFIGAWCRVHRKDRKVAMEGEALLSDYQKSTPIWTQTPRIMIKKVAESIALRKAFPQELNGLYTEEEMPPQFAAQPVAQTPQALPQPKIADAIGDDAPPPMKFQYDLTNLEPGKLPEAIAALQKAGAVTTDDEYKLYWESPIFVKKVQRFLITVKEGEANANA